MFQESLVESTPLLRSRNRWPALISIAIQATLAVTLVAIPILHPEILPTGPLKLSHLDPPPLPHSVPAPRPLQPVRVTSAPSVSASAPPAEVVIRSHAAPLSDAPPVNAPRLPFGDPNGTAINPLSALNAVGPTSPRVVAAPAGPGSGRPLRISTGVLAGMLLAPIQPVYPQMARITHTEGTVVIQAIISKSGRIESAHVISGPPMLQDAALQAVCAARYRPDLLNGQPAEVETTININFRLGS